MLVKGKFYRLILFKKILFPLKILLLYCLFICNSLADLQENLIKKLTEIKTLTFEFEQKISEKEEKGNCYIKYPLLMKCNYNNLKEKIVISNGKTVAIIKKKYKKIYLYPIKSTPLFFILNKEKIINLIKNSQPTKISSESIEFFFNDKKNNNIKIIFDKDSLNIKGWQTKDIYSNKVNFQINNLMINNQIVSDFFIIPKEEDL